MRFVRISLAAKYRILFGLAVALIIAAALCVPWWRMEGLVLDRPFHEAQRAADDYFRLVLPQSGEPTTPPVGSVHGKDFGLLPSRQHHQPQFVPLTPEGVAAAGSQPDSPQAAFIQDTFRFFRKDPKRESAYRTRDEPDGRRFYYAHAVRVAKSCLACHDEGKTARPYRENALAGIITVVLPADVSDWEMFYNRAWIVTAGALAGVLAILVFSVITRRFILAPIHDLREVAVRVTEGDLEVRSTLRTGDEFEQLSSNLNTMLERLRDTQDDLRRANRALDEKLGEMAETNVALYESNRVKSEFLANVSHELRTPLASIIGFAELLREGPNTEAGSRAARYAENILISGRILLEIINDLLDLAKIEAGRVELHVEDVSPAELCGTLIDFMRPMADKKSLTLELDCSSDLPTVRTDRGKLRQILFNLLSNAIKFSPDGGLVRLAAARAADDRLRIEVIDNGPGIAPEHRDLIFEKFRQIDQSATREHTGTGLGLAIAKELAHLLGGQIGVQSEPGQGSAFWLELPATCAATCDRTPVSLV